MYPTVFLYVSFCLKSSGPPVCTDMEKVKHVFYFSETACMIDAQANNDKIKVPDGYYLGRWKCSDGSDL